MRRTVESLLARYGTDLVLVREGRERTLRAMIQPVRSTSLQSMEETATALGRLSQEQHRYIGPADGGLRSGDVLRMGEKRYQVRRVETVYGENSPLYQWGLCVERSESGQWGA